MAITRRPVPPPAVVSTGPAFGDLGFYAGGFTLPKGQYAMEHIVQMFTPTKQDGTPVGAARLGVTLIAHPLAGGEPVEQFLSMGTKAHLSFMPDAQGKGLVPVPGGPASTLPRSTNWMLYLKSMYDSGLPSGVFTNDLSVIDGIHVQTDLVPEPEERKGFGSTAATGEAAAEQGERKGQGLIPIVVEILDNGKPWEGSGGIPAAGTPAAPPAKLTRPVAATPKPTPKAPAAPAAPPAATPAADEDLMNAAVNGISAVLEAEPAGTTKLKLRTGTFKAVSAAEGQEVANAVLGAFFSSDEQLSDVLGQLGYGLQGSSIKPV